jgi:hypothetical protein
MKIKEGKNFPAAVDGKGCCRMFLVQRIADSSRTSADVADVYKHVTLRSSRRR